MRRNVEVPPPQRDGQVEDGEHGGAAVVGEQVSDDGGGDGGVAGLADTHQASGEHKQPVILQTGREEQKPQLTSENARRSSDRSFQELLKFIPIHSRSRLGCSLRWRDLGEAREKRLRTKDRQRRNARAQICAPS